MSKDCFHQKLDNRVSFLFVTRMSFSDLKMSMHKTNRVYFEVTFGNNSINSKSVNLSNSLKELPEKIEMPIQILFDRRINRFVSDKFLISIYNHHLTYAKKIGTVCINPVEYLNNEQTYVSKEFKIDKCSDRKATVKIGLEIELLENYEKAKEKIEMDNSFEPPEKSEKRAEKQAVIDATKFSFLKRKSKC